MPLIRGHHAFDGQFTQIPNAWLRDSRLSLGTRGLLAQLLSHAPGWRVSQENLAMANGVSRDTIRRMIGELVAAGYLSVSEKQSHNELGHLTGFTYTTKDPEAMTQKPSLAEPTKAEPAKVNQAHKKNISKEDNLEEEQRKNKQENKQNAKSLPLAEDWKPNEALLAMFATKWQLLDSIKETESFKLYYWASGKKFARWDLTYQNWMNRAQGWAEQKQSKPAVDPTQVSGWFA